MATFDPKDSLAWRSPETVAKRHREDCLELLGKDGEFCQGGILCSEPPSVGAFCWPHYLDDLWRTSSGSRSTTSTEAPPATAIATTSAVAPILPPFGGNTTLGLPSVPRPETCHLWDLLKASNYLADDEDATSEYDEAGAPPTEGGDVDGQYESSEADVDAGSVDFQEDEDPVLRLAASIPLPGAEEGDDLEEIDEPAGQRAELYDTGSTFHLPGVKWSWPSEASVRILVEESAETRALLRIFPPAQGYTKLDSGRFKCTARARISPDTGRWEAYDCSTTCARQFDYRRHFLTIHLAGSRWEDVARQKKVDAEDSTSTVPLAPKKPRAKREPRQAQPLASTSASGSTSTAGAPPEVQQKKPRQKRRRQVTEEESSEDGDYGSWDQEESDRKGKKARRW